MVKHALKTKQDKLFDSLVLAVAIIEPLSTVPQIIDIFRNQDAESLSLLSWLLFAGASLIWLVYGLRIRSWPLITSSVMWVATELILIIGILRYS